MLISYHIYIANSVCHNTVQRRRNKNTIGGGGGCEAPDYPCEVSACGSQELDSPPGSTTLDTVDSSLYVIIPSIFHL